ncbi:cellulase family glycosylhydrolase [Calothrix sp. 336/3]|uniref:cellulase family glycosylhydrolase n=1 Tax=Calothrix sp. 336/3 TaxID=1337936 RepID=UPI0006247D92|nr:cellulase family glycosylhydrolase [Calothrix sp. 336/3]AKG23921.1 hypothetical protein IJ00_23775 [Calothrix sp. 336/3]
MSLPSPSPAKSMPRFLSFIPRVSWKAIALLSLILSFSFPVQSLTSNSPPSQYKVAQGMLMKNNQPYVGRGVNAMHTFGGSSQDMQGWGLDMVREFIGNFRDNPIQGEDAIQTEEGVWLHPLQKIVQENRAHGKVTILCPFGWDGSRKTKFLGRNPSQTEWWQDYQKRYREVAQYFQNQPDVWFEVWNEPYDWQGLNGYSDALWLQDMQTMVDNIRSIAATNIILVPGAETGQDERVILQRGAELLKNRINIAFDIHAYEKWLWQPQEIMEERIQRLQQGGFVVLFGEVAPLNASELMNPRVFLQAAQKMGVSVCAWLWKYDGSDTNALLTADGIPNDSNNNFWGSTYKTFALSPRNTQNLQPEARK